MLSLFIVPIECCRINVKAFINNVKTALGATNPVSVCIKVFVCIATRSLFVQVFVCTLPALSVFAQSF